MQIFVSTQEQYDKAIKLRQHIGNKIVIRNSPDFIEVYTDVTVDKNGKCKTNDKSTVTVIAKENGKVDARGKTNIIGYNAAIIFAKGNCRLTLHNQSFGHTIENCKVAMKDSSKINAHDNCTVHAYDESIVSATGFCKIHTYNKSTASGTDFTTLSGNNESTLTGLKNCLISAKDNCIVYASENCNVQAVDNCLVVANSFAKVKAENNCLIMSNGKPDVLMADKCKHLNLDNITDKNIMTSLKQMAQTKAVIERPYVAIQILKDNIPPTHKEAVNRRLNTMGLKDQTAVKDYLYNLIEAEPVKKTQPLTPNIEKQLETARKTGYVQGVCECVAVVGNEQNMGKKLLSEMHVTKDMAKKFASPETYKTLEKGIFSQKQDHKFEQIQGVKR
jgi:hypothetical protein